MITVRPLRDFGGWGMRYGRNGSFGVVVRGGEALEVERAQNGPLVVTVDDARLAAAVLNALVARRAAGAGGGAAPAPGSGSAGDPVDGA